MRWRGARFHRRRLFENNGGALTSGFVSCANSRRHSVRSTATIAGLPDVSTDPATIVLGSVLSFFGAKRVLFPPLGARSAHVIELGTVGIGQSTCQPPPMRASHLND
jgi:hypothetical protein